MGNFVDDKALLKHLFMTGVQNVSGEKAVRDSFLTGSVPRPSAIVAVGKAAFQMYLGVPLNLRQNLAALLVTKEGNIPKKQRLEGHVLLFQSSHPMPCQVSLDAGQAMIEFVQNLPNDADLLVLVSGGASALAEALHEGYDLSDLQDLTAKSLADGSDIHTINQRRRKMSKLKGGGLLREFRGRSVQVLAISDVAGDDVGVIGSGVAGKGRAEQNYRAQIVASNELARQAIVNEASAIELQVQDNQENLYGDINDVAKRIMEICNSGADGLYVFGGEPIVTLPPKPGIGGRNQGLALLIAREIQGRSNMSCLVAGTDGADGVSDGAGAIVDGRSFNKQAGAMIALQSAHSGAFFQSTGDQLVTGPTGTNVMDLVLVLKGAPGACLGSA
jgi:hydroxypyruvate reductase